jgi:hypothetical protein
MKKKSKKAPMLKDKLTPLRLVENTPCADTLLTLEHLTDLARKGECQGIVLVPFSEAAEVHEDT